MLKFPARPRISLRVKLLTAVGGIVLSIIVLQGGLMAGSARRSSEANARQALLALYDSYDDDVHVMENAAAALAVSLAYRSDLQALVERRDRKALFDLLTPLFNTLRAEHEISHLYIYRPGGIVLLRAHAPESFGDSVAPYRQIGIAALVERRTVAGVELDPNRLGVCGIAPILLEGDLLGLVEVGLNYDQAFLQDLKRRTAAEYRLWLSLDATAPTGMWPRGDEPPAPSPKLFHYAATHTHTFPIPATLYEQVIQGTTSADLSRVIQFVPASGQQWAVLLAPLYGYNRRILGVVEIAISRAQALRDLQYSLIQNLLFTGGLAVFTMALLTLAIEPVVLRPVRRLNQVAQRQLAGDLTTRATYLPGDELGELGQVFNRLSDRVNALIGDLERQVEISRQAEAVLRVQTEHLDRFFTLALDLLCIANTEGYFLRVNPQWEKTLGYRLEDLNGCRFLDLVHPDDLPATMQAVQELSENKQVLNFVNRYRHQDGSYRWLEWQLSPAGDLVYAAARDITGRIQGEAALRESEARFRQIVEASPMGIHMYRLDDRDRLIFVGANLAADRILGVDNAQFIGQTIEEAFPSLAETEAPMRYRLAACEGVAWQTDQIDYEHGQIRGTFEMYAFQTGPRRMTAMFLDVTERKRAEQKILQRTAELAALNALAREIGASLSLQRTLSVALEGLIKVVQPALAFLFMREGDKLRLQQVLPSGAQDRFAEIPEHRVGECMCGLAVAQQKALYSRNIMYDARCTWEECKKVGIVSFAALPIYDGGAVGVIGLAADEERDFETQAEFLETLASHISVALVNVRLYETVQQYAAELEQRVQERTAQLEAANRELEAFAYSVSHDLRAPLRAMDGFSRALEEDCGGQIDVTGQGYIRRIRGAAQRMGELIDGLLQLSRIARGELSHEQVNLSALAAEVAAELERMHPHRRFDWQIAPGLYAWGDRRMLRAALENLLDNAVKFTSRRDCARIEFGQAEVAGEKVLYVCDNGAGFDMAFADKLFGAFQRLHTANEFPGSGIGLATVQRIIHRHGGRIWAEGRVDGGATFWFTLPKKWSEKDERQDHFAGGR